MRRAAMAPTEPPRQIPPERRKANLRLAIWLAAFAVAVFVGFIAKSALF